VTQRRRVHEWLRLKVRFGLSKIPYLPIRYSLSSAADEPTMMLWWSRVMPFLDPRRGLWDFELYGWDARELKFLRRFLRPEMTFIDIGAHQGLYSVLAGRVMEGQGTIVAFEPTVRDRRRMALHLRLNGVRGVHLEPFAVSNKTGTATFYVPTSRTETVASLRPPLLARTRLREVTIPTTTLDEYCAQRNITGIDIVKVDVEGAEMELMDGASRILQDERPIWIVEAMDVVTRPWGYPARDILRRLAAHEYSIFAFCETGHVIPHQIEEDYPHRSDANYLAVPIERARDFAVEHAHGG
jgi:FkbM family methyltransferase